MRRRNLLQLILPINWAAYWLTIVQRSEIISSREIERRGYQIGLLVLALLLARAILAIVAIYLRKARRRSAELQRLSDAKEQIIEVLSRDLKNPANTMAGKIAERTFLSVHTVNTHRQRIYSKMEVRNVTDMIHKATEMGIL